jgi:signal transduction histidine kinase
VKLAHKLVFALLLCVVGVLSASAWIHVQRELDLFERDMLRDTQLVAAFLASASASIARHEGEAAARTFIDGALDPWGEITSRWLPGSAIPAPIREVLLRSPGALPSQEDRTAGALHSYARVPLPGQDYVVQVSESLEQKYSYTRTSTRIALLNMLILVCLSALLTSALGRALVGRPIEQLLDKIRRIGQGDLGGPVSFSRKDEMNELASALNALCGALAEARERAAQEATARVAAVEQLRHAERLSTIGTLASGVAHELGTPLNVVSGRAQMIASGEIEGAEARDYARIIAEQAGRMTQIIRQLLDFARRRKAHPVQTDLRRLCGVSISLLRSIADRRGVQLMEDPPDPAGMDLGSTLADEGQIQQALTNVLVNAIQATPRGGEVHVQVRLQEVTPPPDHGGPRGAYLGLCVRDSGAGMSEEVLARACEPFFTTKEVGEGTGLGLSVAYGIVREHGGFLQLRSRPGEGSEVTLFLPASLASPAGPAGPAGFDRPEGP